MVVRFLLLAGLVTTALSACSSGPSRADVLGQMLDDSIISSYAALSTTTGGLADATSTLCDDPTDANLVAAHTALAEARASWTYSEAFAFGPASDRRSPALIDWPIAVDEIEELIADQSTAIDVDRLANRVGADQRGLGAVEYLLGDPTEGEVTLAALGDERRCDYLVAASEVASTESEALNKIWSGADTDGETYRESFVDPDAPLNALDGTVAIQVFLLDAMGDMELGPAVGAGDRDANRDVIVEGPAGLGVSDLANHLRGIRAAVVGTDNESGLSPLLSEDLTARLVTQFDEADDAVDGIQPPLRTAVEDQPEAVVRAYDAIEALKVTIATEVVSELGVTIGFSSADGDSGP